MQTKEAINQKVERVQARVKNGEILHHALKAEKLSVGTWYARIKTKGAKVKRRAKITVQDLPAAPQAALRAVMFVGTPMELSEILRGIQ